MSNTSNYQLLRVNEQISENLGSLQIIKTLDKLLFNALIPLMRNSDFIDYVLVELLPHIFLNRRRKFSNKPFDEFRDNMFSVVMVKDRKTKQTLLSKQGLERSVFFAALVEFEHHAKNYLKWTSVELKNNNGDIDWKIRDDLIQNFFMHNNHHQVAQSSLFWLNQAFKFKQMIVEKYIRHAFNEAKKMVAQTNLQIDSDDLFRNLILSIHKAIDKYDPEKGPLTSYVNIWFMETKNNYRNAHEYGVAYSMPTGKRKKLLDKGDVQSITMELNEAIAESVEDESQNSLTNMISVENNILTDNIACRADSDKVYCLLNGIQYHLTLEDIQKQQACFVGP